MKEQEIELRNTITLNNVTLDKNRDITIYCDDKILKIANIEGTIVIFHDENLDVELTKWEGHAAYKQDIRDIEDKNEICSECKSCSNYLVCENGCFGNIAPCEHYTF